MQLLIASTALLTLLSASAPCARAQETDPAAVQAADVLQLRFEELLRQYENALVGYRFDLNQAQKAGVPEERWPARPQSEFYDRFLELADAGSPWAMSWIVENLAERHTDPAALAREGRAWHARMFREAADSHALLRPLRRIAGAQASLGNQFILDELSALFERSQDPSIKGTVLWSQAKVLRAMSGEDRTSDLWADSMTLFEQLLDSYPQSPLAQDAAMDLFPHYQAQWFADVRAWIEAVERAEHDGVDPADWPEPPGEAYVTRMVGLGRTELLQAVNWVNGFWQVHRTTREQRGLGPALCNYALHIGAAQSVPGGDGSAEMFRLLPTLARAFGGKSFFAEFLDSAVEQLTQRQFDPASMANALDEVARTVSGEREQQAALYGRGWALAQQGKAESLQAALEPLGRAAALAVEDSVFADRSRELAERIARVVVGADLSWFSDSTVDGEPFTLETSRGKVVLLQFFSVVGAPSIAEVPRIAAARERWQDRPFEVIGISSDGMVKKPFRHYANKAGVTWTVLGNFGMRTRVRSDWFVNRFPSYAVVDGEGKLAGRDLDLDAALALVEVSLSRLGE